MRAKTYGNALQVDLPCEIVALYEDTAGNLAPRFATVNSSSNHWYTFAAVSTTGRVTSTHHVHVAIGVDNRHRISDLDIGSVRLVINYTALQ